jgi:hypothetical protein
MHFRLLQTRTLQITVATADPPLRKRLDATGSGALRVMRLEKKTAAP